VLFGKSVEKSHWHRSASIGFGSRSDDHARKYDFFDVTEVSSAPITNADT
jgi:hypothetical protein